MSAIPRVVCDEQSVYACLLAVEGPALEVECGGRVRYRYRSVVQSPAQRISSARAKGRNESGQRKAQQDGRGGRGDAAEGEACGSDGVVRSVRRRTEKSTLSGVLVAPQSRPTPCGCCRPRPSRIFMDHSAALPDGANVPFRPSKQQPPRRPLLALCSTTTY